MLNIITGGAGTGKSSLLMERIDKRAFENGAIVIIPDQFSFEYDRMLYKRLGAERFNAVKVLSFSRLAADIFIQCGGRKGRYADDTVKAVLMYYALLKVTESKSLNFYGKQARKPRFIDSSLSIIKELALSSISPELLSDKLSFMSGGVKAKTADISVIYSEYVKILTESGFKDELNAVNEAAERAAVSGFFKGHDIFIDEFKSFTADEIALLDVIISAGESVHICLTTEDRGSAGFSVFEAVNSTRSRLVQAAEKHGVKVFETTCEDGVRFKSPEIGFLSKNILRNTRGRYDGVCENVRIYEAVDIYNEADYVCAQIERLIEENGLRYSDIAVVSRRADLYSAIFEGAFERYEIPFYIDENNSVRHKAVMVFVLSALKLAAGKSLTAGDWLRYVKTGFSGLNALDAALIEQYCYKWDVTPKMWREPFIEEEAEEIRLRITKPLFKLSKACFHTTGDRICEAFYDFFADVRLDEAVQAVIADCEPAQPGLLAIAREHKQLWELLCGLLEVFHRILRGRDITLAEFADLFDTAASKLTLSSPPQTLDCVSFMPAHLSRLANPKAVFVIGANDGELPFAAKAEGLFSERDRLALKAAGIELSNGLKAKIADERFVAYNVLSAPSEVLYITYPPADTSGRVLYPSVIVSQTLNMFGNHIKATAEEVPLSSYCVTPRAAYYSFVQNYDKSNTESASLREALSRLPEYSAKIESLARMKADEARFLESNVSAELFGKDKLYVSATSFEDYQKCPYRYFCKKGLRLYPRQKIDMEAMARGNVIHYCLYKLFDALAVNGGSLPAMSDDNIRACINEYMSDYYDKEMGGEYGKTARFKAIYQKLSDTVLEVVLRIREELSQSLFVPSEFEYKIGQDGEPPMKITATDGTEVYFFGTVDRVDTYLSQKGELYVRVIDYKSGTQKFKPSNLLHGLNMQMLIYLFALTDKSKRGGKYKEAFPAGVLYMPAKNHTPSLKRGEVKDGDIQKLKNSTHRPEGLILDDEEIITAMDKNKEGVYLPVSFKKSGEPYEASKNHILNGEQLQELREFSEGLVIKMAESLKRGEIPALPLEESKICNYCEYIGVCGKDD
ncbi:MAG: PD-(D/E)XK nuclease family protein [Oscillospiraceae bacterium]|nr:PD-(D/E)XK nuclease family protein [Oscillospiraceae bacterium]